MAARCKTNEDSLKVHTNQINYLNEDLATLEKAQQIFCDYIKSEYVDFFRNKIMVKSEMRQLNQDLLEMMKNVIFEVQRHKAVVDSVMPI